VGSSDDAPTASPTFAVGEKARLSRKFGAEEVRAFAELTGDRNPVHLDEEVARRTRFQRPIVHGMLYASLFSAIFGTQLPGAGAIYLAQSLKFVLPVAVGETVTAEVEVTGWRPEKRILNLKTRCLNSEGKVVLDGDATILVELSGERPPPT
jgi:acyl dehydratase